MNDIQNSMRKIPSMDKILSSPWCAGFEAEIGRGAAKAVIASLLSEIREKIREKPDFAFDAAGIEEDAKKRLRLRSRSTLRPVVNATGVIIHTNLGRSLLAREAAEAVGSIAESYNTLEYSLDAGGRGDRNSHVEWLICRLTEAEAALAVNNNAGAVILALSALAQGRESVVSRGELVEIGGSFRIPDIMALSGTKMVEVGTTNGTHLSDYERALNPETGMLLKIHPSNFRVQGFTSSVPREEIAALAHKNGLIFMEDLGSGMLTGQEGAGLSGDPTVKECIKAGADIVTFSGDKLLGGPQIGVIAGKAELLDRLRSYPLLRALRVDKMTLAAFEATLRLYLKGEEDKIPTVRMLRRDAADMKKQAQRLRRKLAAFFKAARLKRVELETVPVTDTVGGGSFPQSELQGYAVALRLAEFGSTGRLAERLRGVSVPVIAAASGDKILFHVRTMSAGDEDKVVRAFKEILPDTEAK